MHDQLAAYFDGELDATQVRTFEEHLTACPDCTQELTALRELRTMLQAESIRHRPPMDLEERVRGAIRETRPTPITTRQWPARLIEVAALAAAVLFGVGLTLALRTPSGDDRLAQEVAANHARSLLADHLFDVASTDQHTVKPWFQGRTDFSPPVTDFKDQGFPLAGGRLDFLDGRPAAALVYRHRQHVINLFVWPAAEGTKTDVKTLTQRGYNLAHWSGGGLNFWAVSDLNADELAEFARLVRDGVR
jgi:anti-sigma factor (TIGR02949 family)